MKLYAAIYLKSHLALSMFLWNGATIQSCQRINAEYGHDLDEDVLHHRNWANPKHRTMMDGKPLMRSDIKLTCEWRRK